MNKPPQQMKLTIKIPKQKETSSEDQWYPSRLPYHILVEYAQRFKTKAEVQEELKKMECVLQQTEKEKARQKANQKAVENYGVKLARFTQLFKTLLAINSSWPQIRIPYSLAAEPSF